MRRIRRNRGATCCMPTFLSSVVRGEYRLANARTDDFTVFDFRVFD
jgi:hypothetical protein